VWRVGAAVEDERKVNWIANRAKSLLLFGWECQEHGANQSEPSQTAESIMIMKATRGERIPSQLSTSGEQSQCWSIAVLRAVPTYCCSASLPVGAILTFQESRRRRQRINT
jgi:hypothetical protein